MYIYLYMYRYLVYCDVLCLLHVVTLLIFVMLCIFWCLHATPSGALLPQVRVQPDNSLLVSIETFLHKGWNWRFCRCLWQTLYSYQQELERCPRNMGIITTIDSYDNDDFLRSWEVEYGSKFKARRSTDGSMSVQPTVFAPIWPFGILPTIHVAGMAKEVDVGWCWIHSVHCNGVRWRLPKWMNKTTRRQDVKWSLCAHKVYCSTPPELLVVLPNMPRYVDMWRALCFLNYGDSPQCPFISC